MTTEADGAGAFDELLWGTYATRETQSTDGDETLVRSVADDLFGDVGLLPRMPVAGYDFGQLGSMLSVDAVIDDDRGGVFPLAGPDDLWPAVSESRETDAPSAAFFAELLEGTCQIASAGLPAGDVARTNDCAPLGGTILVDMLGSDLPAGTSGVEYEFDAVPLPPSDPGPSQTSPRPPQPVVPSSRAIEPADGLTDPLLGFKPGTSRPDPDANDPPPGLDSAARPTPEGRLAGVHLPSTVDGLAPGEAEGDGLDPDFAGVQPAALRGVVWVADDELEAEPGTFSVAGKSGVAVALSGRDDLGLAVSRMTRTDADGRYHFAGLYPGEYAVRVATPRGFRAVETHPGDGGGTAQARGQIDEIRLDVGDQVSGYEFYYEGTGRVAGRVVSRLGKAGRTVGMIGVEVALTGADRDGRAVGRKATTDARGKYLFHALPPGTYRVEVRAEPDEGAWAVSPAQVNGRPCGVPIEDAVAVGGIVLGADGRATDLDFTATGGARPRSKQSDAPTGECRVRDPQRA